MEIYNKILKLQDEGKPCVLITITEKFGHGPRDLATKMLVDENGNITGTIGGGSIEKIAISKAKDSFKHKKNFTEKYILDDNEKIVDSVPTGMKCGGKFSLLYEYISSKRNIYIFGAGHVGQAINYFIKKLPLNPIFIDDRKKILENIEDSKTYLTENYLDFFENNKIPKNSLIVIATYSHEIDFKILKRSLQNNEKFSYIGTIASKVKAKSFLKDLKEKFKDSDLKNLYMPIGLKIGGRTPDDIGLSIVSEVQAIIHNKKNNNHFRLAELTQI